MPALCHKYAVAGAILGWQADGDDETLTWAMLLCPLKQIDLYSICHSPVSIPVPPFLIDTYLAYNQVRVRGEIGQGHALEVGDAIEVVLLHEALHARAARRGCDKRLLDPMDHVGIARTSRSSK
eukprot:1140941-Pelagomonas_calceolata.AAC.2